MRDHWKEWLTREPRLERTLTDHAMKIEPRPRIPGDVRAGLAVFITLAPFAFAAGALLAVNSTADAHSATPSLPPSISDDLSTLPSASPSNAIDVVTEQRTTRPRPPRTTESAEPSRTRVPPSSATTTISPPSSTQATTTGNVAETTTERPQSPSSGSASATSTPTVTPSPSP